MNNGNALIDWKKAAKCFLESKGYQILEEEWACHWGKIDLIAKKDGILVFIKVKVCSSEKLGSVHEAVNYFLKKSLLRTILLYLWATQQKKEKWRFDVITLRKIPGRIEITHFESVPLG